MDESGNDFGWARQQLLAGRSVTRPEWQAAGTWLSLRGTTGSIWKCNHGSVPWVPKHEDLLATDWALFEDFLP